LTEATPGATPAIIISEPTPGVSLLKINLGAGNDFAAGSTTAATGLTYQHPGSPMTSEYATIDISSPNNVSQLAATLPGDALTLGPIYDSNGGMGSIMARAGSIEVVGINTASVNGNVSLAATGNLTVDAGAIVQTGAGTISLAAGVNANGTGNANGVGTLSIDAGATVTSSDPAADAITLRGANINIATGPDPAVVEAQGLPTTTPTATLTGLNWPVALASDASGNLYVANVDNSGNGFVSGFAAGSTTPTHTITGLNFQNTISGEPYQNQAMAVDRSGDLFVLNSDSNGNPIVSEFAPGSTTPSSPLSGLNNPVALACDSSGNLYVADFDSKGNFIVSEFAAGSTTPTRTFTGLSYLIPPALALDPSGDLYVLNSDSSGNPIVSEFAAGSTTPTHTFTGLSAPGTLALGPGGDLYVADSSNMVSEFAPGSTTPTATLTGLNYQYPPALAVDPSGNVYVLNSDNNGNLIVSEFAPGSTTPTAALAGLNFLFGPSSSLLMAIDPSGNVYVASSDNNGNPIVSEFAAASLAAPTAGGVVIRSSLPDLPISLGGGGGGGAGINLTQAELAQIQTTAGGTITIGDSSQEGDITFTNAMPATTPGASTVVLQDPAGPGQIILDDAGTGTGLDGNGGTVSLSPGTGGIVTPLYASGVPLASQGFDATGLTGSLTLTAAPTVGEQFTLVNNTATPAAANPITGTFAGLPQDGLVSASYGGVTYYFRADYAGGDGNDLVLTALEPEGTVALNWAGAGSPLSLTEEAPGTTPAITISEPSPGSNLLEIDLGTGYVFAGDSTIAAAGLTYQYPGSPTTSQYATIDISQPGEVSQLLAALPGDGLTLGRIDDSQGGIGGIDAGAGSIEVTGIDTASASGDVDLVSTGDLVVDAGAAVSTGDGAISLSAAGDLTVGAGATVETGAGTISLAADVNPDGTGNAGVGTLSVGAGATVISSDPDADAITLRGANIQIDTSSDPAMIGASRQLGATPIATLSEPGNSVAMTPDSAGNLYLAGTDNNGNGIVSEFAAGTARVTATFSGLSFQNATPGMDQLIALDPDGDLYVLNSDANGNPIVNEFTPGSTAPTITLNGLNSPVALAVGPNGDLYVVNSDDSGNGIVSEFAPRSSTPMATLSGLNNPWALAFDARGDLYVANSDDSGDPIVSEFAVGHATPTATLTGLNSPMALAVDASGKVYVADLDANGNGIVYEFAAGSSTPTATLSGLNFQNGPPALALDAGGNLYVANSDASGNGIVSEFARGSGTLKATFSGLNSPWALAFDASGNLFVANFDSNGNPIVSEFAAKSTTPTATIGGGLSAPDALALDPSGDLYVANSGNNTVSEFAPGGSTPIATLSGLNGPVALACDSGGNLYVANGDGNTVSEFAAGSTGTTPTATLTGLEHPDALAFDSGGNLYVANPGNNSVSEFYPGDTTADVTYTGLDDPDALAFDSGGNLYVANAGNNTVSEFYWGDTTPDVTFIGLDGPVALALDASGNLFVANWNSGTSGAGTVSEFYPGDTTPDATLTGLSTPAALAFDPSGNLYVVNWWKSEPYGTVSEFAPGSITPTATLSGFQAPIALAFGPGGKLYVADKWANTVDEFAPLPTAGGVVIRSSLPDRPMSLGGTSYAVAGINLTDAELAQIYTTADGTVTIGDNSQTGNIIFTTAMPATTPGAATVVLQDPNGPGQIILDDGVDDGAGAGTALDGDGGTIDLQAGSGGIVAASYNDSTPELSTTGPTVTLDTSGPIGTGSNRIQFADNADATEQNVIIGANYEPTSVFLDGLGSLTLGGIEGGTVDTQIDVTARTNLVVAAGATIDSGGNTLSLGADLNPDGTGDDGVGILSIGAGALVTSTNPTANAITLRGADIEIDTSGTPAVVQAQGTPIAATSTILTGLGVPNNPQALAVDSVGNLYVANYNAGTVSEFAADGTLINTFTGLSQPCALALDGSGDLYVANWGNNTVSEFAADGTLLNTFTGLYYPDALAVDSNGYLYVANYYGGSVSEFAPGNTTPNNTIDGQSYPNALALDSNGDLYVANEYYAWWWWYGAVNEYAPESTTLLNTLNGLSSPAALAFDSSGNLYVANAGDNTVSKFGASELAAGSTTPTATLSGLNNPAGLVCDPNGNLYVANYDGYTVSQFAPGSTLPSATLTGLSGPSALAFDPASGNLYVANYWNGGSVSELAAGSDFTPTGGGVVIGSSLEDRPMSLGGTDDAVAGINLTAAELAQISTTPSGTITIGDSSQTGNITFTTAVPATTAGAATVVLQDPNGPGQIILDDGVDDGAGAGTALDGNGGTISLTAGSGGIVAASANNATAELSTTGPTVTLDTYGPIGTGSNRIQFADDADTTQQNVIIGSNYEPTSVFLDGLGSLTLGNIGDGGDTQIDVTARTDLVVAAGATINSGQDTLSLGADLNPNGTGDDGVGTLSLGAGALVTSDNPTASAITLRGADIDIDTSATVQATAMPVIAPSATLSGLSGPGAMAVDSSGNLYVANQYSDTVSEFAAGSTTPTATLSGLNDPDALACDAKGNLYVANWNNNTVSEFAPGSTTPSDTLAGLSGPIALACDAKGDLYVVNAGNNTVSEFAPGSTTPTATFTGLSGPNALACDSSGKLYVTNWNNSTVSEFAPGSTTPTNTLTGLNYPDALAFDPSGNLYVANYWGNTVNEFAAGSTSTTPTATLAGMSNPDALACDSNGNVYVADDYGVSEFAAGSTTPTATLTGQSYSRALAVDSGGNLYVASYYTDTVGKFTPASLAAPTAGGSVVIRASLPSLPMSLGGTDDAVAGINLTAAELARIHTGAPGMLIVGDTTQTGDITFTTATPATTPGASTVVLQDANGPGRIILDDGAGTGTGLNGNGGTVSLQAGRGGVVALISAAGVPLATQGFNVTGSTLGLTLNYAPALGTQLTIVSNTATPPASHPVSSAFLNLAQGGVVSAAYQGVTYYFQAAYAANGLVLTAVQNPAAVAPAVNVANFTGHYNGAPFTGTATVTGTSGVPAASLENTTPTLTYYNAAGVRLGGAPTDAGTYAMVAWFGGSLDYLAAESAPVAFSILKATPVLGISAASTSYTGSAFAATATVTGVSGVPAASLQGASPTLVYYAGSHPTGMPLAGPPTAPGSYTVVASFIGSIDYVPALSSPVTFSIARAMPMVSVSIASGHYTGAAFAAAATVAGLSGSPAASLEGGTPTLSYYTGSKASGKGASAAPSKIGTYTVLASFAGSPDYAPAQSSPVTFSIAPAIPTLSVYMAAGTYNGKAFTAKATVAGLSGLAAGSLEGVTPTLKYYAASTPSGSGTATAPIKAGTYSVVAFFKGSTDYAATQSTPLAFTVNPATPTVTVADAGGTFSGKTFPAKAKVIGVSGPAVTSLETVIPTLLYYTGPTPTGSGSSAAPSAAGTYTVVASFAGSSDYAPAQSKPLTFIIAQATPIFSIADAGGTYNGSQFPAKATIEGVASGVDKTPGPSLENVPLTVTYYVGSAVGAQGSTTAPSAPGTYTAVASFNGSSDYVPAQSKSVTFTIKSVTPLVKRAAIHDSALMTLLG
jgi:DNA-binding beta-propeller fold protein YncE